MSNGCSSAPGDLMRYEFTDSNRLLCSVEESDTYEKGERLLWLGREGHQMLISQDIAKYLAIMLLSFGVHGKMFRKDCNECPDRDRCKTVMAEAAAHERKRTKI